MRKITVTIAGMAMMAFAGTAAADHHGEKEMDPAAKAFKQGCMAYQQENGGSADCGCLARKVSEDEDFAAEMMTIMGPDDVEALSDASKEKIAACEMAMEDHDHDMDHDMDGEATTDE